MLTWQRSVVQSALMVCCLNLALLPTLFADDAASRAIVEKAIERSGGEKLLTKFKAFTNKMKGKVHFNGVPLDFTGDIVTQGMDQHHLTISFNLDGQPFSFVSVLNHKQGWQKINDSTTEMTPEQLTDAQETAYAGWVTSLVPLKDKGFQLGPFGEIDIGGRKATGVNVTREGHRSINLFFDNETLHVVRSETVVLDESTMQEMTQESNFSDFKMIEGIPHPMKIVTRRNGRPHAEIEVEEMKLSESLDDSTFAKP